MRKKNSCNLRCSPSDWFVKCVANGCNKPKFRIYWSSSYYFLAPLNEIACRLMTGYSSIIIKDLALEKDMIVYPNPK